MMETYSNNDKTITVHEIGILEGIEGRSWTTTAELLQLHDELVDALVTATTENKTIKGDNGSPLSSQEKEEHTREAIKFIQFIANCIVEEKPLWRIKA